MMCFGTLSRYGENNGLEVIILSGDRDTFQLATDKVTIRILQKEERLKQMNIIEKKLLKNMD